MSTLPVKRVSPLNLKSATTASKHLLLHEDISRQGHLNLLSSENKHATRRIYEFDAKEIF